MATRTIKFLGAAYSETGDTVSLAVKFNNVEVFNGAVTTRNEAMPEVNTINDELFTFDITTDDIGTFPLEIVVSGGDFVFSNLQGNYSGFELQLDENGRAVVENGQYVPVIAPIDYYYDLNVNTYASDGKDNVTIEPDTYYQSRPSTAEEIGEKLGDWNYALSDGATFTCDFKIDAERLFTEIPAVEL